MGTGEIRSRKEIELRGSIIDGIYLWFTFFEVGYENAERKNKGEKKEPKTKER